MDRASVGQLEAGGNYLQLRVCRDCRLFFAGIGWGSLASAPFSCWDQWANTSGSCSRRWQTGKAKQELWGLLGSRLEEPHRHICLILAPKASHAGEGWRETVQIYSGKNGKSQGKEQEGQWGRELRPLIQSIAWVKLLKSPDRKQFYFSPNITLKYVLWNLRPPVPSRISTFSSTYVSLG